MKKKRRPETRAAKPKAKAAALPGWLPLSLVLAAAAATHAAILRAPFFADDYLFLDQVRARPLVEALLSHDPLGNFLRPVGRQLHFWIWSHASGESPLVFHVVNLIVFLGAVVLLHEIARRLAGRGPALVAAAFLALQYSADVPLLWASGSQDLLALALGLGAILLAMEDQNVAAAIVFLCAVLSKETAAAIPLLCLVAARRHDESWAATLKRQVPILVALAAWAGAWLATLSTRQGSPAAAPGVSAALATFVHGLQVALGLEWRPEDPLPVLAHPLIWLPLAAAGLAAWWAARSGRSSRRLWVLGVAIAVLGAVPVIAVTSIWSAYFYLLAMAGVGLLLGAACGGKPALAAAVVIGLGFTSANARLTEEFSTALGPWTRISHVNRFYLDRAMTKVARYLEQMKEQEPALPPRSTIFFGNFPGFLGWQAGDGPLARWAYRDSSVRSYYVSGFDHEHAARGPYYFFVIRNDSLVEIQDRDALLQDLWYTRFLCQDWTRAKEIIHDDLPLTRHPQFVLYWLAWTEYALGDTAKAFALFRPYKMSLTRGPSPELAAIDAAIAARDTMGALRALAAAVPRHALDASLHGRLSDLLIGRQDGVTLAGLEASLTTVLDSTDVLGWRRLAALQLFGNGPYEAKRSIDRFFALGGAAARGDSQGVAVARLVDSALPGGALVQRGIRR